MNMRTYYHLLTLRRSKRLFNQTSPGVSHHLCHHPQPPPPPHSYISRNTLISRNATIVSHHRLQTTHDSSFTSNLYHYPYHSQRSTLHTSELITLSCEDDYPHDYHVTVKGREVISAAATLGNHHWLPLSNLDLLLPPIEIGVFFCYKRKDTVDMSPETVVRTVKASLARVLSTFYPLAGEIVPNRKGEAEILCNNRGVEFVHAHAHVDLKDLDFYHPDHSVRGKLVPKINHGVLSVQATELNCGSIIIACAINHQVTDGYSLDMFLAAWAKYAQFGTISNIPSFRPSMLSPRHPPRFDPSLDNLYIPISSLPPPSTFKEPLYSRMYYVHAESIKHLQYEASTKDTKRSKLLSFTAFMWKLLARGNNDTPFRMGIVVNGRRFLTGNNEINKSFSVENHFGNVVSVPFGLARNSELKGIPLHEVANGVHKFVAEAKNEEHFRGLIDWVELHRPTPAVARIYFGHEKTEGEAVVVSSGQGLPVKDMDFGWGNPEFGSYHVPWGSRTGYVVTMPSASGNGDWVVYMHLKQKDLDVIESMACNVFTPLSIATFF